MNSASYSGIVNEPNYKPDTIAVTAGRPQGPGAPLNQPPVLASTFRYGGGDYARFGTESHAAFEAVLGALEGGTAISYSTGMAAAAAIVETVPVGGVVVTARTVYHGVRKLFSDLHESGRIRQVIVDATDLIAVRAEMRGAAMLWVETPSNPLIEVLDVAQLAEIAQRSGVRFAVDSTFATPVLMRPLELGATVVLHSATKYIGGHSDLLMGAAVTDDDEVLEALRNQRTYRGATPGAIEAFLALRGLRTMPLRVRHASANAERIAQRLSEHPAVTRVFYPGLATDPGHELASRQMTAYGAMLSFCVESEAAADAVLDAARLIIGATSLGGVETTGERRNRWNEGAPTGLIRLSVGIEDLDDIWHDLQQALDALR